MKGSLHIRRASVNTVNIPLVTWFFFIHARVFMLLWMCNSPRWIRSSSTTYRLLVLVLQTIKRYIQLIVAASLPCSERFFSWYSGIPLSSKTNTSKFQFDLECTDTFKRVHTNSMCSVGEQAIYIFCFHCNRVLIEPSQCPPPPPVTFLNFKHLRSREGKSFRAKMQLRKHPVCTV